MKVEITLKDPDTLYDCINDAVNEMEFDELLDDDEVEALQGKKRNEIGVLCSRWFEHREYLTVIVDTEKKTCTVKEVG